MMETIGRRKSSGGPLSSGHLRRRASSISQQLTVYQDVIVGLFHRRLSRGHLKEAPHTISTKRRASEGSFTPCDFNRNCLIQQKSPSNSLNRSRTDSSSSSLQLIADSPLEKSCPQTTTAFEGRLSPYHTDEEDASFQTPVTSFSTEDLEDIFGVKRRTAMETTDESSCAENSIHNIAFDHSDIALNMSGGANRTSENGEVLNLRSPFAPEGGGGGTMSKLQMVCREMVMTEKSYVKDLKEVIEGYIHHLKQETELEVEDIFGNLEAIYEFNKGVLDLMNKCENEENEIDPKKLAQIFCDKAEGFNRHYTYYCTNYPDLASLFAMIMEDEGISCFFAERQRVIGHALSLESYLLKPVQRILKYHLLFRDILKEFDGDEEVFNVINTASLAMSDVAEYINEMKRLHENVLQAQSILKNITDLNEEISIYITGRLILQNSFKMHGTRGDRYLYLFENLLLICKKSDELFHYKEQIECSNIMLNESLKDPLMFQIMKFDNQKSSYTFVAKTLEIKKEWAQNLKRLILESHKALIPQTARQAILGPENTKSKYNALKVDALDNSMLNAKKANKMNKENLKRENSDRETPPAKRNNKAIGYLLDKKNKGLNHGSPVITEKDKKEKKWKKKHQKNKPSLDSSITLDMAPEDNNNNSKSIFNKSRSLESLKDSMKSFMEESDSAASLNRGMLLTTNNDDDEDDDDAHDYEEIPDLYRSADSWLPMVEKTPVTSPVDPTPPPTETDIGDDDDELPETFQEMIAEDDTVDEPAESVSPLPVDPLERRLSILSEDDTSNTSIKDMVRKVSNAFNSSFNQATYVDCQRSEVARDLTKILGTDKSKYRRSTGGLHVPNIHQALQERSRSFSSINTITNQHPHFEPASLVVIPPVHSSSEEEQQWSEDVDQVFDDVNAELGNLADSISNEQSLETTTASDAVASPITSPIVGVSINSRAAVVDERLRESNIQETSSPNTARKLNFEVKRVADRIKEYKKLIDAEKRMKSFRRPKEPTSMTEMIESLDSIRQQSSSSSYFYHRKRFSRPSSEYHRTNSVSEEADPITTTPEKISTKYRRYLNSETSTPKQTSKEATPPAVEENNDSTVSSIDTTNKTNQDISLTSDTFTNVVDSTLESNAFESINDDKASSNETGCENDVPENLDDKEEFQTIDESFTYEKVSKTENELSTEINSENEHKNSTSPNKDEIASNETASGAPIEAEEQKEIECKTTDSVRKVSDQIDDVFRTRSKSHEVSSNDSCMKDTEKSEEVRKKTDRSQSEGKTSEVRGRTSLTVGGKNGVRRSTKLQTTEMFYSPSQQSDVTSEDVEKTTYNLKESKTEIEDDKEDICNGIPPLSQKSVDKLSKLQANNKDCKRSDRLVMNFSSVTLPRPRKSKMRSAQSTPQEKLNTEMSYRERTTSLPRPKKTASLTHNTSNRHNSFSTNTKRTPHYTYSDESNRKRRESSSSSAGSISPTTPRGRTTERRNTKRVVTIDTDNAPKHPDAKWNDRRLAYKRSASLPRRAHISNIASHEEKKNDKEQPVWSPSKYCNQQNLVNKRIKQYFLKLQQATTVSPSRPNLSLVAEGSFGHSDSDDTSSEGGRSTPRGSKGDLNNYSADHILRGTVRNMIKKYAENYIFDK